MNTRDFPAGFGSDELGKSTGLLLDQRHDPPAWPSEALSCDRGAGRSCNIKGWVICPSTTEVFPLREREFRIVESADSQATISSVSRPLRYLLPGAAQAVGP